MVRARPTCDEFPPRDLTAPCPTRAQPTYSAAHVELDWPGSAVARMRELERSLGLPSVVAISVGAMLGGEIFLLPAVAAGMTGASLWLAYLLAALLVIPAALTKAELSTAIPSAVSTGRIAAHTPASVA